MTKARDGATYLSLVGDDFGQKWGDLEEELPSTSIKDGDGGGSGMEPRIAKLEANFTHIERDVGELRADMRDVRDRLTRIETRVDHLPTKGFVVTSVVITLTVMTGLITFQDRVQKLIRQAPESAASSSVAPPSN